MTLLISINNPSSLSQVVMFLLFVKGVQMYKGNGTGFSQCTNTVFTSSQAAVFIQVNAVVIMEDACLECSHLDIKA